MDGRVNKKLLIIGIFVIFAVALTLYYTYFTGKEKWMLEIYIDNSKYTSYKLSELELLSSTIKLPDGTTASAVSLVNLIKNINISTISKITPYGVDGYHRDIPGNYALKSYILILKNDPENGPLRFMTMGLSRKYWVKALVRIVIEVKG